MKFTSESGKLAGMKSTRRGVKDTLTEDVKSILRLAIANEVERIPEALDELRHSDCKAYIDAVIKLLPFVISKAVEENPERPSATWPSKVVFNVIKETPPPSDSQWIGN
jgi:hypothetical protein